MIKNLLILTPFILSAPLLADTYTLKSGGTLEAETTGFDGQKFTIIYQGKTKAISLDKIASISFDKSTNKQAPTGQLQGQDLIAWKLALSIAKQHMIDITPSNQSGRWMITIKQPTHKYMKKNTIGDRLFKFGYNHSEGGGKTRSITIKVIDMGAEIRGEIHKVE